MIVKNLLPLFSAAQTRGSKIKKSLIGLVIVKFLSLLIALALIPMTLNYLGPVKYGIWLILGSIVGWAGFFDLGLSNGLRNKLGEALAKGDIKRGKILISSTLAMLSIISILIYLVFWMINPLINWQVIFNAPVDMVVEINLVVIIAFSFFILRFVSGIIGTVLMTDQRPALADGINAAGALLTLFAIYILTLTTKNSLIYVVIFFSAISALVPMIAGVWFFYYSYRHISPSYRNVDISYVKELGGQGIQFFSIQICALVLFTTDNIIITQLFGPAEVVPYNISHRLFNYVVLVFGLILTPFWAIYNEAYNKNDLRWIKTTTTKMIRVWLGLAIGVVILFLLSDNIYTLWLGSMVAIPTSISFFMALFVLVQTFNMLFVTFIFSTGKLRVQIYAGLFAAAINLPLSYIFAVIVELGPAGVILSTAVCCMPNLLLAPIQCNKLIHRRAHGIWAK